MTKRKISITVTSLLLLIIMCFSFASCGLVPADGKNSESITENDNDTARSVSLKTEFVNTSHVRLMAASEPMMVSGTDVITQKIVATVLPIDATNKQVDWRVSWGNTSKTENISDYITVIPDGDGSTSATVTCKAAFEGTIIITATTRQNGYKADCIVTFVGIPVNIDVVTDLTPEDNGYHVAVGNSYNFGVALSNPFGAVGEDYKTLKVTVEGVGLIKVAAKEISVSSGNVKWYDEFASNLNINNIASEFVDASVATDGSISVHIKKSIESYYGSFERIDSGRTQYYEDCFRDYVTDCYFKIVLTEVKSGVSTSFNVVIDPNAVTDIDLSKSEMFF